MSKKRNLIFLSLLILGILLLTGCWLIPTTTYTVTFDSQGGSVVDPQTVGRGGLVIEPTAPMRTGYAFAGWYKELECINAWDFANDTVTSDVTLYAKWAINTYTVTFNKNGGTTEANPKTKTATHGGNVGTLPTAPTRTGYTFTSWNTKANGSGTKFKATTAVTADITVYAQWTINTYTVTYDGNGSTSGTVPSDANNYQQGATVTVLYNTGTLVKTGHTFAGWNTKADGSGTDQAEGSSFSIGTENITLYAKWDAIDYTVTFNSQGGSVVSSQTVEYGNLATEPTAPTWAGYTFGGWYKESGCTNTWDFNTDTVTSDVTLYAKWTGPVHNVTQDKYYTTIQAALDVANSDDIIEVADGTYDESITFPSDKVITLQGASGIPDNVIIQGANNPPTVEIYGSSTGTTLSGFTITHNNRDAGRVVTISSRGISINYGNLIVDNCTISGNFADYGGGIYNGGTLTITSSTISGNSTDYIGGGIYNEGTLTITSSTISGNTATYSGGGIYHDSGTLTITSSTISDNDATDQGGGIYLYSDVNVAIGGIDGDDTDNFNDFTNNCKTGYAPSADQHIRNSSGDCHTVYPYNSYTPN